MKISLPEKIIGIAIRKATTSFTATVNMKKIIFISMLPMLCSLSHAGSTILKTSFASLHFDNSKTKDKGMQYEVGLDCQRGNHLFQALYGKTDIDTFQPPLSDDLHINKIYFKYSYQWDEKQSFHGGYAMIDDNLVMEADGCNIYGAGYGYKSFGLTQYFSDYKHFNVYQTDMKYAFKKEFDEIAVETTIMGKYICLEDGGSNKFTQNAKDDYFTAGLRVQAKCNKFHFGFGVFFGKRIFAVMNNGFGVQHHAMEFNETYMLGVGRKFENVDLNLKYIYQEATEIPIRNRNVKVQCIMVQLAYHF